ncbi:hypothetical protein Q0F98_07955 [Paenibacillus amylolyticus]|nr:hypothetical protein Q0F98_07955 [Paenibacillus amylolyticus]
MQMHTPEQMLQALEVVLQEAERLGLQSVRVDTLMGGITVSESQNKTQLQTPLKLWKRIVVALWLDWEKLFHWVYHLRTASPEDPMLHFRSRVYHGARVEMNDGHVIQNGDPVIELHFDNQKLFELGVTSAFQYAFGYSHDSDDRTAIAGFGTHGGTRTGVTLRQGDIRCEHD